MKVYTPCNNCFIIYDDKYILLQSYNTEVAVYNTQTDKLIFGQFWDFSRTTLKHIKIFLEHVNSKYKGLSKKELQALIDTEDIDFCSLIK